MAEGQPQQPRRVFAPVGYCIYCLNDFAEVDLSDEHIVPFALGGALILPKSSCNECAKETSKVEASVLRGTFRGIKERLKFPSRTRKRPETLPIFCVNGDESKSVQIPLADYPALIMLPQMAGPTAAAFPNALSKWRQPWLFCAPQELENLNTKHGIKSFAANAINIHGFARMLMKIAHSFAVAIRGDMNFIACLPDLILNDRKHAYLGCVGTIDVPYEPEGQQIKHALQLVTEVVDGKKFLTCHIRLFSNLGTPAYRVIVGFEPGEVPPLSPVPLDSVNASAAAGEMRLMVSTEPTRDPSYSVLAPDRIGEITVRR